MFYDDVQNGLNSQSITFFGNLTLKITKLQPFESKLHCLMYK